MDLFWIINKVRYSKPIENFIDCYPITIIAATATYIIDTAFELIKTDVELWIILATAVLLDFITGLISTKIRKNPVTSLGARQTIVKTIEYILFLGLLVMVANAAENYINPEEHSWIVEKLAFLVKDIDIIGFFIAIWIEIISIGENTMDKNGAIKSIVEKIRKLIKKEIE